MNQGGTYLLCNYVSSACCCCICFQPGQPFWIPIKGQHTALAAHQGCKAPSQPLLKRHIECTQASGRKNDAAEYSHLTAIKTSVRSQARSHKQLSKLPKVLHFKQQGQWRLPATCVVLLPGAAQASSTCQPGCAANACAGRQLALLCTHTQTMT